jgi:hypothetical protein
VCREWGNCFHLDKCAGNGVIVFTQPSYVIKEEKKNLYLVKKETDGYLRGNYKGTLHVNKKEM